MDDNSSPPPVLPPVALEDKYTANKGRVFLTGTQALVRLPMMQRQRDEAAGINTAGFISGYRGSPLGGYDQALWAAEKHLKEHHIHFEPGVNEELAATAIWGSQQLNLFQGAEYDGVFSIWYGKGPGVDRCGDVFKHGNAAGSSEHGGVLCVAGDDHAAVSSTLPHQSDHNFMAAMMPVLAPSNVQEYLDLGLMGWAMSRFSGCWVGFKATSETAESTASVSVDPDRVKVILPHDEEWPSDMEWQEGGLNIRWPDPPLEQEKRLHIDKIYAAIAFARANKIDKIVIDSPRPRFGIITTGKAYMDVRQALDDLGIDDDLAAAIGLRLYKVAMPWPLERHSARHFAEGLEEVLVVEEKRTVIEDQLKAQLYNWSENVRPRVIGNYDEDGTLLLPTNAHLTPAMIARVIAGRISKFHNSEQMAQRVAFINAKEAALAQAPPKTERIPFFCSGCPHNTSTKLPEGSRALAGIGCHYMVQWMNRSTDTFTQMGGEGTPWIGQAPFTSEKHVFANLGDGTYYHSGILAVRAAVAADVPITYKILYNDAVAMTGGQPMDGPLQASDITWQTRAEGVKRIAMVSDEPEKFKNISLAPGTTVHHRRDLIKLEKELRDYKGVSVLVYDQTCAAEKRRRRKRGLYPDPPKRVFINEAVCEGCGDCSVQSNCVSIQPVDSEWGRKRQIDQSSCNKDYSCVDGFCPSFVTVHGGSLRRGTDQRPAARELFDQAMAKLTDPPPAPDLDRPWGIMITGIGGTGVVTIGALLGMAAHIEGKGVSLLDMAGLAQKNGAVMSHIRIAKSPDDIHAVRLAAGGADLLLGCDMVVSAGQQSITRLGRNMTTAIVNDHLTPTAAFTLDTDTEFDSDDMRQRIAAAAGPDNTTFIDASRLATALLGDSIATNMFMLGYGFQRGLIPISLAAITQAITLNGVAIDANLHAFSWGRIAANDPQAAEQAARPDAKIASMPPSQPLIADTLDDIVAVRVDELTAYQSRRYAKRFKNLIDRVASAEQAQAPGNVDFAKAVARNYFKLLAYKDEYEVARLYSSGEFAARLESRFEGDYKLKIHLAPPLLARRNPETGHLTKRPFGGWVLSAFKMMQRLKFLRGTFLDPFGYTAERRMERDLIGEYETVIAELTGTLSTDNHALAIEIAQIPERIRGFGHIKEQSIVEAKARQQELLAAFRNPAAPSTPQHPQRDAAE